MDINSKNIFNKIYSKYSGAIYRYILFRVYTKNLAEELMQETFMRIWKYLSDGKRIDSPQALLYRIARNLIIDLSRRNKIKIKIEDSFDSLSSNKDLAYDGVSYLEHEVLMGDFHDVMKKLPNDSQEILTMRYIEGRTPKEIANIFHTNANNISVKIYKSLKKLHSLV